MFMGMAPKSFIIVRLLVVLYLGFSFVLLQTTAVPATRSLSSSIDRESFPKSLSQDGVEFLEERMTLEMTNDYTPTGPNPRHQPPPIPARP